MKYMFSIFLLILSFVVSAYPNTPDNLQNKRKEMPEDSTGTNPNYDAALAMSLGADDYGMKSYVLVILKSGANKSTDKTFIAQCFRGHMDNINRLEKEGQLIVAGPLAVNDNHYRGIFILDAGTMEEARLLLQGDPAIKEGLLDADLYKWYGSAALPLYLDASDKIWKQQP